MSGMQQNGANIILNLGTLTLAGDIEGDAGTTLQIATPYAKDGDAIALSLSQQFSGAEENVALTEYFATDGFLNFTFVANDETTVALDSPIEVALLRSPGFPAAVTAIGGVGLMGQESTPTPEPGPGPSLPLFPFAGVESLAHADIDPSEAGIIQFGPLWAAPPPSQGGQLPIALNGPFGPPGLAIIGWRSINNLLELNVKNVTAAPIACPAGIFAIWGFAVGGRATPNTQRTAANGNSQSGPVRGWYSRKPLPAGAVAAGETFVHYPNAAGNFTPLPVGGTRRFVASSVRGLTQADGAVFLQALPLVHTANAQYELGLYSPAGTTLAANQVTSNLWTFDTFN